MSHYVNAKQETIAELSNRIFALSLQAEEIRFTQEDPDTPEEKACELDEKLVQVETEVLACRARLLELYDQGAPKPV